MKITMPIEILQDDSDKTNYLALITAKLNERFTSQEDMESWWRLYCLEVAKEIGAAFSCATGNQCVTFDFSINNRMNEGIK